MKDMAAILYSPGFVIHFQWFVKESTKRKHSGEAQTKPIYSILAQKTRVVKSTVPASTPEKKAHSAMDNINRIRTSPVVVFRRFQVISATTRLITAVKNKIHA
jgi:ribosomal protein S8